MPKLLLADDSVTIQRVIELTFSGEDVDVISVGDGDEAVTRIAAERPDVVLADIGMPRRNGYEVAAFVKGRPELAHIPVLLLAGAFEPVDQGRAEQVRCDGVLVKPFEPQQVIARVRELLDRARPAGEPAPALRDNAGPARREPAPGPPTPGPAGPPSDAAEGAAGRPPSFRAPTPEPLKAGPPPPRVPDPIVEIPEPAAPDVSESLDDYFDRLDAAFASLNQGTQGNAPAAAALDDLAANEDVPTIDDLLTTVPVEPPGTVLPTPVRMATPPIEAPDASPTLTAAPAPRDGSPAPAEPPVRNLVADAFARLLAAEQGGGASGTGTTAGPAITDDLVDELTRRVLQRLAPDVVRDVVTRVVSDVSERLVREEIARIRGVRP